MAVLDAARFESIAQLRVTRPTSVIRNGQFDTSTSHLRSLSPET
jgi:hypothetical protein